MWKPQNPSKLLLNVRLAPPKVPKKRSRAGCTFCKEKKKKCDEQRPCARCAERGLDCAYEPVKPRQRRKRHSLAASSSSRPHPNSPRLGRSFSEGSHHSDDSLEDGRPDWTCEEQEQARHLVYYDTSEALVLSPIDSNFDTTSLFSFADSSIQNISPTDALSFDFEDEGDYESSDMAFQHIRRDSAASGALVQTSSRSLQTDLAMIEPCPTGSPLREFRAPGFIEFSDHPNRRALVDHFCSVLSHLIVFREESGNPFQQLVLPLTYSSSPVMNAIYALASAHLECRGVENGEKSLFFHNQAIQGLAKLIESDGKMHRNEILATIMLLVYYEVLVQRARSNIVDGHLKGALAIMCNNQEPLDATGVFLERAFRFYDVIAALSNGTAPLSAAPAAGCLVPFPPLGAPAASPLSNVDTLLGMATTLWPIIHRLSNLLSLKSELEEAVRSHSLSSKIAVLRTEFESTAEAIESALTQWQPNLPPKFVPDEKEIDDPTFVANVVDEPQDGGPSAAANATEERRRIHSILHNALAYRHSAFVYLYRTVHAYPRSHGLVQTHARLALTHCVHTVSHAGPMSALLWPLFVSACEAVRPADRDLAGRAFDAIKRRQGMMNIERAWEIVKEVWRRADVVDMVDRLAKEEGYLLEDVGDIDTGLPRTFCRASSRGGRDGLGADLWRRVSEDMGVNVVFG